MAQRAGWIKAIKVTIGPIHIEVDGLLLLVLVLRNGNFYLLFPRHRTKRLTYDSDG